MATQQPDNPRLTPAQRHKRRILAARAAAATDPGDTPTGSAYELAFLGLTNDRRQLKKLQSIERKTNLKRQLVPNYDDYIAGVLEAGKGAQDEVFTTLLVWNIDIGRFDQALKMAEYALAHDLQLPDQYNRDIATMMMDEVAGAYLGKRMPDPETAVHTLRGVAALTEGFDAPDQARAKLHKAIGLAMIEKTGNGDLTNETKAAAESAQQHLTRALELHSGSGVKKQIESLGRKLKKLLG